MFIEDISKEGFEPGTYKLGQKLWATELKTHRFHIKNNCGFCGGAGTIVVEGINKTAKAVECPICHGKTKTIEVKEMVIDDMDHTVRSIFNFTNANGSYEVYMTNKAGLGLCIQKSSTGENNYYTSKKEAQAVCDAYNKTNHVYEKIAEYEMAERAQ